jgi:hypothetical protein
MKTMQLLLLGVLVGFVVACSQKGLTPALPESLVYSPGTRLVYENATYRDDVEISRTFDTVVIRRRVASGSDVRLEFDHDGAWVISGGAFTVVRGDTVLYVIGAAPPSLPDTTSEVYVIRNESGDSTSWYTRHTSTMTLDTTIETTAGSFQCAKRLSKSVDKNGALIRQHGTEETYYSIKHGVVQQIHTVDSSQYTSFVQERRVWRLVAIVP